MSANNPSNQDLALQFIREDGIRNNNLQATVRAFARWLDDRCAVETNGELAELRTIIESRCVNGVSLSLSEKLTHALDCRDEWSKRLIDIAPHPETSAGPDTRPLCLDCGQPYTAHAKGTLRCANAWGTSYRAALKSTREPGWDANGSET